MMLPSCSGDDLSDTSVIKDSSQPKTAFDRWLDIHYVQPYNIQLKYRMEDKETDFTYTLAPADVNNSVKLAHIVLHTWLQAYDEVAGIAFTRQQAPKVFQFIGSPAFETDNRYMMGQAEGGMKITLFDVNELKVTRSFLNNSYFQSIHHEFTHILAQNKNYDTDFQKISEGQYEPANWYASGKTETYALQKGFISTYAMSEYNEDFAETLGFYLVDSPAEWEKKMATADSDGHNASAIILQKLSMVRSYMQTAWNIDIDRLRTVIQRRMDEVIDGKVDIEELGVKN
ncbi:MAG: putative zinc-binding metallopeptidase [Prevotella sp.]|nr:putative zinc-binding metallopeptidase [Prevotella sp.]MBQ9203391.1 putative zinc-binding metallopeptidase [Prevotella sp.]